MTKKENTESELALLFANDNEQQILRRKNQSCIFLYGLHSDARDDKARNTDISDGGLALDRANVSQD